MHLCERKKSFIKFPTLILCFKVETLIFGRFGILTLTILGGGLSLGIIVLTKTLGRFDCEWPLLSNHKGPKLNN